MPLATRGAGSARDEAEDVAIDVLGIASGDDVDEELITVDTAEGDCSATVAELHPAIRAVTDAPAAARRGTRRSSNSLSFKTSMRLVLPWMWCAWDWNVLVAPIRGARPGF